MSDKLYTLRFSNLIFNGDTLEDKNRARMDLLKFQVEKGFGDLVDAIKLTIEEFREFFEGIFYLDPDKCNEEELEFNSLLS